MLKISILQNNYLLHKIKKIRYTRKYKMLFCITKSTLITNMCNFLWNKKLSFKKYLDYKQINTCNFSSRSRSVSKQFKQSRMIEREIINIGQYSGCRKK